MANSLASQGLFGSRARPGMNGWSSTMSPSWGNTRQIRLGSLSGSSLGDDTPQTATPAVTVLTAPGPKATGISRPMLYGAAAVAAWYFLFRKKR